MGADFDAVKRLRYLTRSDDDGILFFCGLLQDHTLVCSCLVTALSLCGYGYGIPCAGVRRWYGGIVEKIEQRGWVVYF